MSTRNLKLTLAYDGTRYHGFQDQGREEIPTIQRALERAWERLTGECVRCTGAGRTDAGVHARGQVANFRTRDGRIPTARVPYALNSVLPDDIRIQGCVEAPESFHARFDALAKVYIYRVENGPFPSPLERLYSYFVPYPLDLERMRQAASLFTGRHDFRGFAGSLPEEKNTVRTMIRSEVKREGAIISFVLEADGFLYHMVRTIVGTLLEVGRGKREPESIAEILKAGDRRLAGPTAPGRGLILETVRYDEAATSRAR